VPTLPAAKLDRVRIVENFYKRAPVLRAEYSERFSDPRAARVDRFVWDYWHIPDQYLLLRTPAEKFFSAEEYLKFMNALLIYGKSHLGCSAVSPPWLSLYTDGAFQGLHADVPHGPWAYVFSLTEGSHFSGGETLLLKDRALNYWSSGKKVGNLERKELIEKVSPRFNRLVVFDPRIPHGVERVEGVRDPLKARLVIHGWFTQPRPFAEGDLSPLQVSKLVNSVFDRSGVLGQWADEGAQGTFILCIQVNPSGSVSSVKVLTHTLRDSLGNAFPFQKGFRQIQKVFLDSKTPAKRRGTRIVIPLMFEGHVEEA
jgi:hypothetical protein